jgi:hypothetical protein
MSVFRGVLAVVAGFVVASAVMMAVEFTNGRYLYPELGRAAQGVTDPEVIRQLMATAPSGALVVVLVGWALGSIAGGVTAARISTAAPMRHAVILGVLLTLTGIANNLGLPPPLWFWVAGMGVLLPGAYLGGRMGSR